MGWPGPLFLPAHQQCRRAGRDRTGHLAVATEIRSPSPSFAVSRGRSLIGRGPDHSTHARTELRRPSDLFGPMRARPKALRARRARAENPAPFAAGLFGVDRPPSPD
ncbi:hypothetical protein OEM_p101320 (plasmid) [Mycobacterium intracellulare subsp. yongonense 05-1390]|nr:hypothetical protein OEM_p101320 [Mycobacterium intracellulare subsp. yongonense 05-1390]